ncbi:hypothetical protein ACFQS3_02450 [Glycomyces mayteni]|uniref:Uncharacterized protein n=1 Tax=Glycomyces mayteni TaxID=543887 RepID=A0ABW2D193_9ACTN|nr:hypothetical protein GCM10025732_47890 [Glycomyces mayteni]
MELSAKELSMLANALDKEYDRLVRVMNGRDMFNNTAEDYFGLIGRVMDERMGSSVESDHCRTD